MPQVSNGFILNPEVSVIMPAYNAEKFIAESIESVINQTCINWELLIVDDGSTDNTKTIIQNFCSKDSRVKYYYQQNGKQGKARNLALSKARGQYVAFLDADDIWLPEKLRIQLILLKEKNVDLVFCGGFTFNLQDANKVSYEKYAAEAKDDGYLSTGYLKGASALQTFFERNTIPVLTVLMKAEVIRKVKGFSEEPAIQNAEDYHLWLKLLLRGYTFYGSSSVLVGYRLHDASVSFEDKQCVVETLNAFQDLKKMFKPDAKFIGSYQKKWFINYHYSTNNWTKKDYRELIKKNCSYIANPLYNFIFQTLYTLFGLQFTRNVLNKAVNSEHN